MLIFVIIREQWTDDVFFVYCLNQVLFRVIITV